MYRAAVKNNVVVANPFAELALPPIEPQPVFFYEPDEAAKLYEAAGILGERWRVVGRDRTGLVFTAPEGGPVSYANFRNRSGIRLSPPLVSGRSRRATGA